MWFLSGMCPLEALGNYQAARLLSCTVNRTGWPTDWMLSESCQDESNASKPDKVLKCIVFFTRWPITIKGIMYDVVIFCLCLQYLPKIVKTFKRRLRNYFIGKSFHFTELMENLMYISFQLLVVCFALRKNLKA